MTSPTPFYDDLAARFDTGTAPTEEPPLMADHRAEPAEDDAQPDEGLAPVNPKVIAAGIASGVAAAAITILVWILGMFGVSVPPEVQTALITLIPAVAAGVAGWKKRGPA